MRCWRTLQSKYLLLVLITQPAAMLGWRPISSNIKGLTSLRNQLIIRAVKALDGSAAKLIWIVGAFCLRACKKSYSLLRSAVWPSSSLFKLAISSRTSLNWGRTALPDWWACCCRLSRRFSSSRANRLASTRLTSESGRFSLSAGWLVVLGATVNILNNSFFISFEVANDVFQLII